MNLFNQAIADAANAAAKESTRMGAPFLADDSPLPTLVDWLAWNDPNGDWENGCYFEGEMDVAGFTVDHAWCEIATMLDGAS